MKWYLENHVMSAQTGLSKIKAKINKRLNIKAESN